MKVMLVKDVYKLGRAGDIKKVADGYGRNFLLPRKLAMVATPGAKKEIAQRARAIERRGVEKRGAAQLLTTSAVMIEPQTAALAGPGQDAGAAGPPADGAALPPPHAYRAVCIDISRRDRALLQDTFMSLLEAARLKDNDTGNHIYRVNKYAQVLAEDLLGTAWAPEVDKQFVASIGLVAALHDVGKIGTPDDILNKAGALETWEWDVMKQHTTNGAFILSTYPDPGFPGNFRKYAQSVVLAGTAIAVASNDDEKANGAPTIGSAMKAETESGPS